MYDFIYAFQSNLKIVNFDRILQVMRERAVGSARVDENADVLCALQDDQVILGHPRLSPLLFFLNTQLSD